MSIIVEDITDAKKEYFGKNLIANKVTIEANKTYAPQNSSKKKSSISPIMSENN